MSPTKEDDRRLGPVRHTEFPVHGGEVELHRMDADAEISGHLRICESPRSHLENLQLTPGECLNVSVMVFLSKLSHSSGTVCALSGSSYAQLGQQRVRPA